MNYWIITDTHFGHDKIMKYCGRPDDFESRIMLNLRKTVQENDVLIHLGDFCWGDHALWHKDFMNHVKCRRWLIKGNHDKKSNTWYHHHGWDCVADSMTLNLYGEEILFSHRPITVEGNFINVHGHHHNTGHHPEDSTDDRHKLVYMEHKYTPVNLRHIIEGNSRRG